MKIIISHDVDHIYSTDHVFKDLILEKACVRSLLQLCRKEIDFKTFWARSTILFRRRMHRVDEMIAFDREHGIPSTFFLGMSNGLGMSYSQKKAIPLIQKVIANGFDAGVHGIEYQNFDIMKKEHDDFASLSGLESFGIRNHYVRFDENTFEKMDKAGYLFDSTWFNKKEVEIRPQYKVGNMWEFPLHIMDSYICKDGKLEEGIKKTKEIILDAESIGFGYFTILAHDTVLDEKRNPEEKEWYEQTVNFCIERGYEFISFREAVKELESR